MNDGLWGDDIDTAPIEAGPELLRMYVLVDVFSKGFNHAGEDSGTSTELCWELLLHELDEPGVHTVQLLHDNQTLERGADCLVYWQGNTFKESIPLHKMLGHMIFQPVEEH